MKIILSIILLIIANLIILWLFSDEHCDKAEEKMIKNIVKERYKEE